MIKKVKKLLTFAITLLLAQATLYAPNKGLVNQNGNDCFFSASFQCLSQIKPFIEFFEKNPNFTEGEIQKRFYKFIQDMKTQSRLTRDFRNFITSGATTDNFFLHQMKKNQQDAQEFLSLLLQYLISQTPYHIIIAKNLKKIIEPTVSDSNNRQRIIDRVMEILNTDMQKISSLKDHVPYVISELEKNKQEKQAALLKHISLVGHETEWAEIDKQIKKLQELFSIFDIMLCSTVTCLTCKNISTKTETARALQLPIPEQKAPTLNDCIEAFKAIETLQGAEQWFCSTCKKKVNATKQITIAHVPQILVLSLKRFRFGGVASKITTPVQFPLVLEITTLEKTCTLDLFGIVCHGGGASGGHYWAYTKDKDDNQWRCYNDSSVTGPFDNKTIEALGKSPEPYMFFYINREAPSEKLPEIPKTPQTPQAPPAESPKAPEDTDLKLIAELPALAKNLQDQKNAIDQLSQYLKAIKEVHDYALVAFHLKTDKSFQNEEISNIIGFITTFNQQLSSIPSIDLETFSASIASIKSRSDEIYDKVIKNLYSLKKLPGTAIPSTFNLDNTLILYGLFDNALGLCNQLVHQLPDQKSLETIKKQITKTFDSQDQLTKYLQSFFETTSKLLLLQQKIKQCEDALNFTIPEIIPKNNNTQRLIDSLQMLKSNLAKLRESLKPR